MFGVVNKKAPRFFIKIEKSVRLLISVASDLRISISNSIGYFKFLSDTSCIGNAVVTVVFTKTDITVLVRGGRDALLDPEPDSVKRA